MDHLLVFDYDGVLVDSYNVFKHYFLQACRDQGIEAINSEADFLSLFDGNLYERMLQQGLTRDQILSVVLTVRDGITQECDNISLFPGIKEAVHELADDNTLTVVTSNDTEVVQHLLTNLDIDCFTDVIGSDKEPSKQAKLERLSQKYPSTYYIGDTVGNIQEGRNASATTIAAAWGWHDEQRLRQAKPDYLVHTPAELCSLFSR